MARKTVEAFIREYEGSAESSTPGERGAKFLYDLAEHYPKDFCSRRMLVRVSFNLSATPKEGNVHMERLHYLVQATDRVLERLYSRHIVSDAVEGYRATVDSEDMAENKYRPSMRRTKAAAARTARIGEMIDVNKLHGALKKEFTDSSRAIKQIGGMLSDLQLPAPKKKEDDERKPK